MIIHIFFNICFTVLCLILSVGPLAAGWEESGGGRSSSSSSSSSKNSSPYFDSSSTTNITAQIGTHAFLPCKVNQLGNKSVSWIRKRDSHILTVDRYTFIADERFQVLHNEDTWTLQIKFLQSRDEGTYECQVTTEPKLSLFVNLEVVIPQTKILGESDLFVKHGSIVQVKCVITQCLEPPSYVFWFQDGNRIINSDGKHQWMDRMNPDTMIGTLVIKQAEKKDSGNYTCAPSNLESASITLHVLNGEHPAAMQQGSSGTSFSILRSKSALLIISSIIDGLTRWLLTVQNFPTQKT